MKGRGIKRESEREMHRERERLKGRGIERERERESERKKIEREDLFFDSS